MDIAIFGLGYVRAASAAYLSRAGHTVVGVDSNEGKAELINAGKSPVVEKDVDEMIAAAVAEGQVRATTDHRAPSATASWRSCASAHEPRQRRPRPHLY